MVLAKVVTRVVEGERTVDTFATYMLHDPVHHLADVRP